jgi:hypothetical protein
MRRFKICGIGATAEDIGVWLDPGFCEFQASQTVEAGERPDVIFGPLGPDNTELVRQIGLQQPKVVVLLSPVPACLPQGPTEDYRKYGWQQAGVDYLIATCLAPQLTEPEWTAYGREGGLNPAEALKAVSDQIYRHLLADVFQETQDWCGHTFSVVISC